jgi:hypothetical protein
MSSEPGPSDEPAAPLPAAPEPAAPLPVPGVAPLPAEVGPDALAVPEPGSWELDMAAASLTIDTEDTDALFEALGGKLQRILGSRVQVQREGGLRRRHRIGRIVVDTGEGRLEATRSRTGPVFLLVHAVRGITLQTAEIDADDWLARLVAMVGQEASRSNDVRNALGRLLDT